MLILDNKMISYAYDLYQGVPILPYYDDPQDTELRDIVPFLIQLSSKKVALKEVLKQKYNYNQFANITFSGSI